MSAHTQGRLMQGRTLMTPLTERWTKEERDRNEAREKCLVFTRFTSIDQGLGRKLVAQCHQGPEDARRLAACWNAFDGLATESIERIAELGGVAKQMPDARRLAACWNACGGVSTEHLERHGLPDFAQTISDLVAQRDELQAVARGFRQKLATYVSVYPGDKQLRRLLDECDAAIAKTGGAA